MINEDSMPTFPEKLLDIIRKNKIKMLLVVIINNPQIIFLAHYKFFFLFSHWLLFKQIECFSWGQKKLWEREWLSILFGEENNNWIFNKTPAVSSSLSHDLPFTNVSVDQTKHRPPALDSSLFSLTLRIFLCHLLGFVLMRTCQLSFPT